VRELAARRPRRPIGLPGTPAAGAKASAETIATMPSKTLFMTMFVDRLDEDDLR